VRGRTSSSSSSISSDTATYTSLPSWLYFMALWKTKKTSLMKATMLV